LSLLLGIRNPKLTVESVWFDIPPNRVPVGFHNSLKIGVISGSISVFGFNIGIRDESGRGKYSEKQLAE